MATHQCIKCLKKTNEDGALDATSSWVAPDSECTAPGGGAHSWNALAPGAPGGITWLILPCAISSILFHNFGHP